jgi:5-oxoprolinase (ATP-hydrolysing) subunit A
MAVTRIDLNSDMGEIDSAESEAIEVAMMPLITSVNIACGAHAGNPDLMRRTAMLAVQHGVAIGAHPGLPDTTHFGRRERQMAPDEIVPLVTAQIRTLASVLEPNGIELTHVKPHGALYTMAGKNRALAEALVQAVISVNRTLTLFALAGSELAKAAQNTGLPVRQEAFADRAYLPDRHLVPRSQANALLKTEEEIRNRLRDLLQGFITCIDGSQIPIQADSLCIHTDTPHAVPFARIIRNELESAGVRIEATRHDEA